MGHPSPRHGMPDGWIGAGIVALGTYGFVAPFHVAARAIPIVGLAGTEGHANDSSARSRESGQDDARRSGIT